MPTVYSPGGTTTVPPPAAVHASIAAWAGARGVLRTHAGGPERLDVEARVAPVVLIRQAENARRVQRPGTRKRNAAAQQRASRGKQEGRGIVRMEHEPEL